MSINIESEASCRRAYINYYCYDNSMGITDEELSEIQNKWSNYVSSWQKSVSTDENQYEFDDSDYSSLKAESYLQFEENTDAGNSGRAVGDSIMSATGAACTAAAPILAEKSVRMALSTGNGSTAGIGTSSAAKASFIVGCTLGAATAATYYASRPNKDSKEACDELYDEMLAAQEEDANVQSNMEEYADQIMELSDEATEANEDANDKMKAEKAYYDKYYETYQELKQKVESGEATDDEKAEYEEAAQVLQVSAENIDTLSSSASDTVSGIYGQMGDFQDQYDDAAGTIANIEGAADYAESIDEAARTSCIVEGAAQTLNAASSTVAAAEATAFATSGSWFFGATAWAYAFAALGFAAAGSSTAASVEQFKWQSDIGNEIDARKDTQNINAETFDSYGENIDYYAGWMEGIEDLELDEYTLDVPETAQESESASSDEGGTETAANENTSTSNPFGSILVKPDEEEKE